MGNTPPLDSIDSTAPVPTCQLLFNKMNKSKGTFNKNPSNWKARGFKSTNVVSETVASTFATGTNMIPVNRALSMKRKFKTTDTNSNEAPAANDTTVEKPALSIEKKLKTTDTNSNEAPVTNDAIVEKPAPTIPLKIKKKKSILKKKHNAPGKLANNQTGKSGEVKRNLPKQISFKRERNRKPKIMSCSLVISLMRQPTKISWIILPSVAPLKAYVSPLGRKTTNHAALPTLKLTNTRLMRMS